MIRICGGLLAFASALALAACAPGLTPVALPSSSPSASVNPEPPASPPAEPSLVPADCAAIESLPGFPAEFAGHSLPWNPASTAPAWPADTVAELQCAWLVAGSDTTSLTVQFGTSNADSAAAVAALAADGYSCVEGAATTCRISTPHPLYPIDIVSDVAVTGTTWIAVTWGNSEVVGEDLIGQLARP